MQLLYAQNNGEVIGAGIEGNAAVSGLTPVLGGLVIYLIGRAIRQVLRGAPLLIGRQFTKYIIA